MRKQEPFDLNNYNLVENFGEQIRKLRESKNMTVEDFAKTLFVTSSYLLKVEQSKLKPSASLLLRLYEKYNLLLVEKSPDKKIDQKVILNASETSKTQFKEKDHKRNFAYSKFANQKSFNRNKGEQTEAKFVGVKEIYAPDAQSEQKVEPVNYNNKKKIIL